MIGTSFSYTELHLHGISTLNIIMFLLDRYNTQEHT